MRRNHLAACLYAAFLVLLCVFLYSCQGETKPDVYFTVNYETDYGTAPQSKQILSGTELKAADLPEITADGYTFDGWYIGSSLITPELHYPVTMDITLKAKWIAVTVQDTPTTPTTPTNPSTPGTQTNPEPSVTPTTPESFTITFETEHTTAPAAKQFSAGTVLSDSDLPLLTVKDYEFGGWYSGNTKITAGYTVTSDITLTAKWTPVIAPSVYYTITYVSEHGEEPVIKQVLAGTTLAESDLPTLTAQGYVFGDWYLGSTKITAGYIVNSDLTLTAWWGNDAPPEIYYTVSYITQFEDAPETRQFLAGDPLLAGDLLTLSHEGYKFDGWYYGTQKMYSQFPVTQDMTFVARWIPYYTVTYETNRGTAPFAKQVLSGESLYSADLPQLEVSGYAFAGWYVNNTLVDAAANYKVTSDITLTAKWVYTITYTSQQGTAPSSMQVLSGTTLTDSYLPVLSCTGYGFVGWFIGDDPINSGYVVADNITLSAKWILTDFNILISVDSSATQGEIDFAISAQKSGTDYIITATPGFDLYLWSVDGIDGIFIHRNELNMLYDNNGDIPTVLTQNTLTFNESILPERVVVDGTYRIYCQAIKIVDDDDPYFERSGVDFVVIKL